MTTLDLAASVVLHVTPETPPSTAITFARELLDTQRRLEIALADNRRLVHQVELPTRFRPEERIWPLVVRCDTRGCKQDQPFDPLPEEAVVVVVLQALLWRTDEDGKHYCPRCRRG